MAIAMKYAMCMYVGSTVFCLVKMKRDCFREYIWDFVRNNFNDQCSRPDRVCNKNTKNCNFVNNNFALFGSELTIKYIIFYLMEALILTRKYGSSRVSFHNMVSYSGKFCQWYYAH